MGDETVLLRFGPDNGLTSRWYTEQQHRYRPERDARRQNEDDDDDFEPITKQSSTRSEDEDERVVATLRGDRRPRAVLVISPLEESTSSSSAAHQPGSSNAHVPMNHRNEYQEADTSTWTAGPVKRVERPATSLAGARAYAPFHADSVVEIDVNQASHDHVNKSEATIMEVIMNKIRKELELCDGPVRSLLTTVRADAAAHARWSANVLSEVRDAELPKTPVVMLAMYTRETVDSVTAAYSTVLLGSTHASVLLPLASERAEEAVAAVNAATLPWRSKSSSLEAVRPVMMSYNRTDGGIPAALLSRAFALRDEEEPRSWLAPFDDTPVTWVSGRGVVTRTSRAGLDVALKHTVRVSSASPVPVRDSAFQCMLTERDLPSPEAVVLQSDNRVGEWFRRLSQALQHDDKRYSADVSELVESMDAEETMECLLHAEEHFSG